MVLIVSISLFSFCVILHNNNMGNLFCQHTTDIKSSDFYKSITIWNCSMIVKDINQITVKVLVLLHSVPLIKIFLNNLGYEY
jgi:hypothetical protein